MEKTALVVGSSSGLGLEIVNHLLDEGYYVFGGSRSGTPVSHGHFSDLYVDVTDETSVESMYTTLAETTTQLDLIVYSAGHLSFSSIEDSSIDDFSEHYFTNAVGAFLVCKYGQPYFIPNETHLIFISKKSSSSGLPKTSALVSSKYALNGFVESAREEYRKIGIRFTTLFPGPIKTQSWEELGIKTNETYMSIEDFIHVFSMVIKSSNKIYYPEIHFLHKDCCVE